MHGQTPFGSLNVKYNTLATRLGPDGQHCIFIGQQLAFPQHFVHVSLLHAGVAVSPSVVPLLAGYEHEQPVEHVPLPPETLIHFCNSAYQRHVHDPVQGCSVVVVVVVDEVVLDDVLLDDDDELEELLLDELLDDDDELEELLLDELLEDVVVVTTQSTTTSCP